MLFMSQKSDAIFKKNLSNESDTESFSIQNICGKNFGKIVYEELGLQTKMLQKTANTN